MSEDTKKPTKTEADYSYPDVDYRSVDMDFWHEEGRVALHKATGVRWGALKVDHHIVGFETPELVDPQQAAKALRHISEQSGDALIDLIRIGNGRISLYADALTPHFYEKLQDADVKEHFTEGPCRESDPLRHMNPMQAAMHRHHQSKDPSNLETVQRALEDLTGQGTWRKVDAKTLKISRGFGNPDPVAFALRQALGLEGKKADLVSTFGTEVRLDTSGIDHSNLFRLQHLGAKHLSGHFAGHGGRQ